MLLGDLIYRVGADITKFDSDMAKVSKTLSKLDRDSAKALAGFDKIGDRLTAAGTAMTAGLTVPIAGVGIAATKMASDFDLSMRQVTSLLGGVGDKEFKELSDKTLALSRSLGVDAVDAAHALYEAISAGVPADNAVDFLRVASVAAIAGVTDTKTAVNGLTTIIQSYGLEMSDAKAVSDAMFQAVNVGKMTFPELSGAIGIAAGSAHLLGISYQELLAASATLTLTTGQGVNEAMTMLQSSMRALIDPSKEMSALLKAIGFESGVAATQSLGLEGTLEKLWVASGKNVVTFNAAFGRIEAFRGAVGLTGTNASKAAEQLEQLNHSTDGVGASQKAFEEINKSLSRQMEAFWTSIKDTGIQLGQTLIPALTGVVSASQPLLTFLADAVKWFSELPSPVQTTALAIAGMVAVVGPATLGVGLLIKAVVDIHNGFGLLVKILPTLGTAFTAVQAALTGSTVAATALNVALNGLVIGAAVYTVYKLVDAFNDLKKAKKELADSDKRNTNELLDLGKRYQELGGDLDKLHDSYMRGANAGKAWWVVLNEAVRSVSAAKAPTKEAAAATRDLGAAQTDAKAKVVEFDATYAKHLLEVQDSEAKLRAAGDAMVAYWEHVESGAQQFEVDELTAALDDIRVRADALANTHLPAWMTGDELIVAPVIAPQMAEDADAVVRISRDMYDQASEDGDKYRGDQVDRWGEFGRQVSTVVTNMAQSIGKGFLELLWGSDDNDQIREQEAELRASLASRAQDWADYEQEVSDTIAEITQQHSDELAEESADLMATLGEMQADYDNYAVEIGGKIADVTREHEEAYQREADQLQESLSDRVESYEDYVADIQDRLAELDKQFNRSTEDAETRSKRETEDYEEGLSDQKTAQQRAYEDKKRAYDRDTANLKAKIDAELAKGNKANQESVAGWRNQLREKEEDFNAFVARQGEDLQEWIDDHKTALDRELADIESAQARRKEDYAQDQQDLVDSLADRKIELDNYAIEVEGKLAASRAKHAEELAGEIADLQASLSEKKGELDKYAADLGPKLEALKAQHAAEQAAEIADVRDGFADKLAEYDKFKADSDAKLAELEDSFKSTWERIGGFMTGAFRSAAEAAVSLGTEAIANGLMPHINALLAKIPGISSIFGGGGAAGSAAGGVAGAGGSAGSGAAGAVSGVAGWVGAIGSIASAVVSGIGLARLEGTMNAVELNTRKAELYLGGQSDGGVLGVLWKIDTELAYGVATKALEKIRDEVVALGASYINPSLDKLKEHADAIRGLLAVDIPRKLDEVGDSVAAKLDAVAEAIRGIKSAANLTINVSTQNEAAIADAIVAQLRAQGVIA